MKGEDDNVRSKKKDETGLSYAAFLDYVWISAVVSMAVFICYLLQPIIGYQTVGFILLFLISLLPLKFGTGPMIVAAGLSSMAWNYFFIPPAFTFAIGHSQDLLMFVAYFVIAVVTGTLTAKIRGKEQALRSREERAIALYSLTQDLSAATSMDEVVRAGILNLRKFMNADALLCLSENDGDMLARPHELSSLKTDDNEFNVIAWVYWNEQRAGRFTGIHPDSFATYYPISGPRYPLGVLGVRSIGDRRLNADQETLLENFIKQIASALEREQLNELSRRTLIYEESERLYKNLFDSLSHEFKTPISTILGSVEQVSGSLSPQAADTVDEIRMAAERLERLVGNLLNITRLESGFLKPKMDWCDISDLIGTTVRKLESELKTRSVSIRVHENMPLIMLDTGLTEQALTNLLHNASQYTPADSKIAVGACVVSGRCVITVTDNGPGIPEEAKDKIFQKFYRASGERTGGTGLGLSIARGFIESQGGTIVFRNGEHGGAEFVISLPLEEKANVGSPS